ncbi:hypothetical protein [Agreia sp. Leaf244]|uniref:hypothetical protein n=1 Tax=Agreia sp. Leaf244 TaxID=1736305 RepID=UPI00268D03AE
MLLALTPVLDLILLAANAIDLSRGSTATFAHGLAAIYLGVSVAYGHKMIQWADTRFAHRFADGPAPTKRYESAYTAECWRDVVRTGIALAIAASVLWLLIAIASDPQRSAALTSMFGILGIIAAVELVRAIGYTLWPKKTPVVA